MSKQIVREALELCNEEHLPQSNKRTNKKIKSITSKSLIEQYHEKKNKNNLDKNLSIIKKISKPVVKFDTIRTAVLDKRTLAALAKKQPVKKEESFFTEQDFKEFEKTYFNKKSK